ncbi:mechanosensitive ion channel family protein [Deminuibacter soli]|uniref:Mechanosensitive ion channel family protein n=1 Tax=Deminuibacter soli TaxID=2291815 RepID=A0A3E1NFZ3_9BACT|nr:mechanosensitive ion channel domain-containing protein [Deminuibacter soli]RFM26883.1 mechanosensitive ion channel family protein [Deminuibacter soli]
MNIQSQQQAAGKVRALNKKSNAGIYLFLLAGGVILFAIAQFNIFRLSENHALLLKKLASVATLASLAMLLVALAEQVVKNKVHEVSRYYNLVRALHLAGIILIVIICISFLNQNWYAAAVSLGLISLVLGFALQSPIASFIGWFYILFRSPYKVGDRIQTGDLRGDVVEIGYLDTTLWEFGGDYMSTDIATGRLIRFPNSLVWQQAVYNYSWHKFPYIWNEIPFHIAYESDLDKVEDIIRKAYQFLHGDEMIAELKKLRAALAATPVDEPDAADYPIINFRIHDNTWVEVLITYLVEPKLAAAVQTALIKKVLADFRAVPDQVLFPKSNSR